MRCNCPFFQSGKTLLKQHTYQSTISSTDLAQRIRSLRPPILKMIEESSLESNPQCNERRRALKDDPERLLDWIFKCVGEGKSCSSNLVAGCLVGRAILLESSSFGGETRDGSQQRCLVLFQFGVIGGSEDVCATASDGTIGVSVHDLQECWLFLWAYVRCVCYVCVCGWVRGFVCVWCLSLDFFFSCRIGGQARYIFLI